MLSWTDSLFYYNAPFGADLFLCHQDLLFNRSSTEIHLVAKDMVSGEEISFKVIIMLSIVIFYLISNVTTSPRCSS